MACGRKNGGIRFVIKILGKITYGTLKGFLSKKFKISGKTFLGDNFVAVCIICFAEANISTFTNLIHSAILSTKLSSFSVIMDLKL